jgi:hypothetical protein
MSHSCHRLLLLLLLMMIRCKRKYGTKKWFRIKSGEACSKIVIFNMHSFQRKPKQSSKNDAEPARPP